MQKKINLKIIEDISDCTNLINLNGYSLKYDYILREVEEIANIGWIKYIYNK